MIRKTDWVKTTLIVLATAAIVLGVLTFFVVFYPSGSYEPVVLRGSGGTSFSNLPTSTTFSTTTQSSTNSFATSTPTLNGTDTLSGQGGFLSNYSAPYPVSWNEGRETFSITGASFQGDQLTLALAIQMSNMSECVPVGLRIVTDESGTLQAPNPPNNENFIFPDTQTCNGTPGATYSKSIVFTISPSVTSPFLLTTGGASNIFFSAATSTAGGVDVTLPSRSG